MEKEKEKWNLLEKQVKKVEFLNSQRTDKTGKFTTQNFSKSQPPNAYLALWLAGSQMMEAKTGRIKLKWLECYFS